MDDFTVTVDALYVTATVNPGDDSVIVDTVDATVVVTQAGSIVVDVIDATPTIVEVTDDSVSVDVIDPTPTVVEVAGAQGPAGAAYTPTRYDILNVASFTVNHGKSYVPNVWLLDLTDALIDTDVLYAPGQVTLVFPSPFTGKVFVG